MESHSDIPVGWVLASLEDLVLAISYGHTAPASLEPIGPRLLRITDIQDNAVDWAKVPYCQCDDVPKYLIKQGDIVIARTGATTGKSYLVERTPEPTIFASYLIRLATSVLRNPRYLERFMKSPAYWEQITVVSKGTAQPGANATILANLQVPVAPEKEQRRIVDRIEALQRRTRRARQALDAIPPLIEKFRQSVLASAFRGDLTADWREQNPDVEPASALLERIREERRRRWEEAELEKMRAKGKVPSDEGWKGRYKEPKGIDVAEMPSLPLGWCWARAEEICEQITKGTTPASDKMSAGDGDVPYIKVYNLTFDGRLDFSVDPTFISLQTHTRELARSRVYPGDVLMNIVGPPLGKVSIVPTNHPEWNMNQAVAVFRPVIDYEPSILASYLMSPALLAVAKRKSKATAGQFNLTLEVCRDLPIPIIPCLEQEVLWRRIETSLAAASAVGTTIVTELRQLNTLDQSILAKAFCGELVPQDPNDEPASVLLERIRAEKASQEPRRKRRRSSTAQLEMFEEKAKPASTPQEPSPDASGATDEEADASQWVKDWLSENPGWHTRADVIAAVEIGVGNWNRAIEELLASGEVERKGQKRGTRYRFRGDDRSLVAWWFAEHPGWHSRQEVLEDLEIDAGTWNPAIRELVAEGEVVRTGEKRGTRYRWWEDEEDR